MGRWKTVLISRAFQVPVIAMVILVALSVWYYRSAVRRSEAAVNERSLRILAGLAEEFSNRLANLEMLRHANWKPGDIRDLRDLVPFLESEACPAGLKQDPQKEFRVSGSTLHLGVGVVADVKIRANSNGSRLRAASANATPAITDAKVRTNPSPTPSCWSYSLESLMRSLEDSVPKGIFDDLLLADSSGRTLYQTQRSGIRISDLNPLFEEAEQREIRADEKQENQSASPKATDTRRAENSNRETGKGQEYAPSEKADELAARSATSRLIDVDLGGEPYKVYTVPVPVWIRDGPAPFSFIVGGTVRARAFQTERATPLYNTLVTIGLFVLFGAVATYPSLKLRLIGPAYELKQATGFVFVLQVVFATLLVGGLTGHLMFSRYEKQTEKDLESLASSIEDHLAAETRTALSMLGNIEDFYVETHPADLKENKAVAGKTCLDPAEDFAPKPNDWINETLNKIKYPSPNYLYFDHAYFADRAGNEEIKFSARHFITPEVRVCDAEGFKRSLREAVGQRLSLDSANLRDSAGHELGPDGRIGKLWRFRDPPDEPAFWIEAQYSKSTGRYLAYISRPSLKLAERAPVAVIGTTWVSVSQPVVPPDYGFAVVDRSGKVLFDSMPAKNGRENFADACDRSRRLHDLLELRESGTLETSYLGIRHLVRVQPIKQFANCPWSIVTFRDLTNWDEDHFDSVQLFFFLAGSYFIVLVVAGWLAGCAKRPPSWIWPAWKDRQAYWRIFWVLNLAILCNIWLFLRCDGTQLWVTAFTIPIFAVYVTYLKLRSRNRTIVFMSAALGLVMAAWTFFHDPSAFHYPFPHNAVSFWIPFTCLCAVFACLALPFGKLSRISLKIARPSLAAAYALPATALLFTIGLTPALRLFNCSVLFQNVAAARRSQLELADQLQLRQERIIDAYSGTYGDQESARGRFLPKRLIESEDRYYLDPGQSPQSAGGKLRPHRPEPLLSFISANILEHDGSSPRHRSGLGTLNAPPEWCEDESLPEPQLLLRTDRPAPFLKCSEQVSKLDGDRGKGWIASLLPQKVDMESGANFWAFLIMIATVIAAFFALRYAIKRLFVLDWKCPEPWLAVKISPDLDLKAKCFGSGAILLGAPRSGKTEALVAIKTRHAASAIDRIVYIDLVKDPQSLAEHPASGPDGVVVLDHFEHFLDNSLQRQQELRLLERLVYEVKCRVIIVTTVDPLYYFDCLATRRDSSGDGSDDNLDTERWAKVLARFRVVRATNASVIEDDPYFAVWQTCLDEERLALRQVAEHGWANYRQKPALTHLFQRRLLTHKRNFKVIDPLVGNSPQGGGAETGEIESNFARYIRHSRERGRLALPKEGGTADLGVLRIVLFVVGGIFIAALAYVWGDQVVSYVVAGAGAVAPAIRAIASAKNPGSEKLG